MRSASLLVALAGLAACRDRVDRDKLAKATALAGAPPATSLSAPANEPTCPAGAELYGAPRPRGSGMWCSKSENGRATIYRTDGTLWATGPVTDKGFNGEVTFYASDGRVALVRSYEDNYTRGEDDVRIEGVELPPTMMPVCTNDMTVPPSTTRCPK